MTVNPKIECNLYSGPIASEAVFEYFSHLILMDAGSDGFRLKDATGSIVTIPTGVPVNMNYLAQSGRICRYMSVMAPLSGTLNVTYVSDVPKGSPTDVYSANAVKLGGYYNWFTVNRASLIRYGYLYNRYAATHRHSSDVVRFGYLYNWYTATDIRNLAPAGWHVPDNNEMYTLRTNLDPAHPPDLYYINNIAGGMMKETGFTYWDSPNTGANNSSGFSARGSGHRLPNGQFGGLHLNCYLLNTYSSGANCGEGELTTSSEGFWYDITSSTNKTLGFTVRLIKDSSTDTGTMVGNDGRVYSTVKIGNQVWMAENLAETKFRNGDLLTKVTDGSAWAALTSEGYCAYNNDESNAFEYVYDLAPAGWHLPLESEILTLRAALGGASVAGGKLKEAGTAHWGAPNTGADNSSGFTALGSGIRRQDGVFTSVDATTAFWLTDELYDFFLSFNRNNLDLAIELYYTIGNSVRFIKDDSTDPGTMTGNDGKSYRTCKIGSQVWMAENLSETLYNNGDAIVEVKDDYAWSVSTTGARCSYNNEESSAIIGGFAPIGYHVPTFAEIVRLINFLTPGEGGKLKEVNPIYWILQPNVAGDNSTGFSGRGIGERNATSGAFEGIKEYLNIWTSTESDATTALAYELGNYSHLNSAGIAPLKNTGLAVRFIKDDPGDWSPGDTIKDYDGNDYNTVQIGGQVFTKENHRGIHFNDGTAIALITEDAAWAALAALSTPGVSFYNLPL